MTVLQKWRISSRGLNLTPPPPLPEKKQTIYMNGYFWSSFCNFPHGVPSTPQAPSFASQKALDFKDSTRPPLWTILIWIDVFVSLGDTQVGTIQAVHAAKEMYSNYVVGSYQIYK